MSVKAKSVSMVDFLAACRKSTSMVELAAATGLTVDTCQQKRVVAKKYVIEQGLDPKEFIPEFKRGTNKGDKRVKLPTRDELLASLQAATAPADETAENKAEASAEGQANSEAVS